MRRSMLFIPSAKPKMVMFAASMGADTIIFDLEDAVSPAEKDSARILLRNILKEPTIDFSSIEVCVRVNSLDSPFWQEDLNEIVPLQPGLIMTPKIESADDVKTFDTAITKLELSSGIKVGTIGMVPLIETAKGIENAFFIASACTRVKAMLLGGEDYTANLQCKRTKEGNEIDYARKRIVNAARAAGVEIYDTPYTDAHDDLGILDDAAYAKSLGFTGKSAISPRHVDAINNTFSPTQAEVDYAYDVADALEEGKKKGLGVVALRGKMIDKPVEIRARQTIAMAKELGIERSPKDE